MNSIDLTTLAWELDAHGLSARADAVRRVARWARVAGVDPILVDVLADETAPDVARLRAFGHVASRLATVGSRHDHPTAA